MNVALCFSSDASSSGVCAEVDAEAIMWVDPLLMMMMVRCGELVVVEKGVIEINLKLASA